VADETEGVVKIHHYQPDHTNGPDHRGDYRCLCGMPKTNAVHDVPELSEQDRSGRIIGEGAEVDE